ncbi:hypothetical protein HZS_2641 [Henneguya salminicola]|nr:hypothetical protein HZS_2641 [Henneguya salminicola]
MNREDRINNYVKAAHRILQAEFGMNHLNIRKFKGGIRSVRKRRNLVYEQFVCGAQPPSYRDRNIIDDLRGIALNF